MEFHEKFTRSLKSVQQIWLEYGQRIVNKSVMPQILRNTSILIGLTCSPIFTFSYHTESTVIIKRNRQLLVNTGQIYATNDSQSP
jgi:hypothetical protein